MAKKQFGSSSWLGVVEENSYPLRSRGFGYFIKYCDCGAKFYISQTELLALLKKTDFPLPLTEIIKERIVRKLRIPKISFVVEWRRLEEIQHISLGRTAKMIALRRSGYTLEKIGQKFGLSRQRICQLLKT